MKQNRRVGLGCIVLLCIAVAMLLFIVVYVILQPQPRVFAQTQQALVLDDLRSRTAQGDVFLVIASGQPSYTCTGCTVVAENTVLTSGYRSTLNVRLSSQWELIATQGGQVARVGNVYTQRFPLMGK